MSADCRTTSPGPHATLAGQDAYCHHGLSGPETVTPAFNRSRLRPATRIDNMRSTMRSHARPLANLDRRRTHSGATRTSTSPAAIREHPRQCWWVRTAVSGEAIPHHAFDNSAGRSLGQERTRAPIEIDARPASTGIRAAIVSSTRRHGPKGTRPKRAFGPSVAATS